MWFKRRPKNRRLGREYVLDVKLRSSQVRAARVRLAALALALIFGSVLGIFLAWRGGAWALDQLIYENKAFAIEELDVQTDGIISVDQLRRWAGVRPGANLLALDSARVKRDLMLVSRIQAVAIERVLPHTLRIFVTERQPIALVYVYKPGTTNGFDKVAFQLDSEGFVIVPLQGPQRAVASSQQVDQFPEIRGLSPNEIQAGRRIDLPQLRAALDFLVAFDRSPMQGLLDINTIDISTSGVLNVTTSQQSQIAFGLKNLDQQLLRWHTIVAEAQRINKAILNMDLAVTNSIPVVFQDAAGLPPTSPKPAKQLKRKHV